MLRNFNNNFKKGENSTNLIIGGSKIYTGAPFFSSIASLRSGSDLSFIMTHKDAIVPIKILLPEAIVLEISFVLWIMNRINVCIVGPGLGRETTDISSEIIKICMYLNDKDVVFIFDGDGIYFFIEHKSVLKNLKHVILTPNHNEFFKVDGVKEVDHCVVVKKGIKDVIRYKSSVIVVDCPNSLKRCGGQGDILNGIIATLVSQDKNINMLEMAALGCRILRKASLLAFNKKGRSLITSDIVEFIYEAMFDYEEVENVV